MLWLPELAPSIYFGQDGHNITEIPLVLVITLLFDQTKAIYSEFIRWKIKVLLNVAELGYMAAGFGTQKSLLVILFDFNLKNMLLS